MADANVYRVACFLERILTTTQLRLPGSVVLPVRGGDPGSGQFDLLRSLLAELNWPTLLDENQWRARVSANRPWTVILMPRVRANSGQEAAEIARLERDRIAAVLAFGRSAGPRPVVTVVEALDANGNATPDGYLPEDEIYRGNLIGGFIAGEDQESALVHRRALDADPVLRLVLSLYRQAMIEADVNVGFFRLWSILEVLSLNRVPATPTPVVLSDGSEWPGNRGNTTRAAAPRVYTLVRDHCVAVQMDENSLASQLGASFYEAVRVWYARRNATAHYGSFEPDDPIQKSQGWFKWASRTLPPPGDPLVEFEWLRALRETVRLVVARELNAVGEATLSV